MLSPLRKEEMTADPAPDLTGLSEGEAASRLRREGPNLLPRARRRNFLHVALDTLREPMFALLLGAGLVYLVLGDLAEALILLLFATISVTIAIIQESRSERVLEALRDLTSPRALVLRDGMRRRIAGRDVVRGDILVLGEGDRVPADAVLRVARDLRADESLLTGEAVPVSKHAAQGIPDAARPGGDDLPFVFSGTLIVHGEGIAEVCATGPRSEIGKIGLALGALDSAPPPLQAQTRGLVRSLAAIGLSLSAVVVVLYVLLRGSWLDGLLGGIALGMSLLPEEIPLVLTVFLVMGAWRMSRARVLTRRAAAIETLGAATLLCTDKTGTLTQNRMAVAELWNGADRWEPAAAAPGKVPAAFASLLEFGILASAAEPVDPMEVAFHELGRQGFEAPGRLHPDWRLAQSYGLRPDLFAVTQLWRTPDETAPVAAAKGAPEAIARLCRLDGAAVARLRVEADGMASRGMRILGVARAEWTGAAPPSAQEDFAFEFLGLVGLADPLRPSVVAAVRECRAAGIKVAMITGDYPATAQAIARSAGIDAEKVMTGEEIAAASDDALAVRVKETRVFARVLPEQKLRLVSAFIADGEVVAMTGDGVNDAPALKAAHIGVAMGGRGTDVAREAAAIVLLDDDFGSIVHTVRLGRRIYDNLRKVMGYLLAIHVLIAGIALLPLLLGWPLMLAPVHIAFLEMVIDPVSSIVFEAEGEEADAMKRKPRDPREPLFSRALLLWGVTQGAVVFAAIAAILAAAIDYGMPETELRALVFTTLVATNFGLIFVNRSFSASVAAAFRRANRALWWVLATTVALLAIVLFWEPARALFRFGPLHLPDLALCVGGGFVILIVLDWLKPLWRKNLAG
jgi:P-type Ca2+ transporter type 2C